MEHTDDILKILARQTELLNNLQSELNDIKKTLNKDSQTDSETSCPAVTEDDEDTDFTFWNPEDGDEFHCIWISDSKTSYKNPIIVCNDFVDVTMSDASDFYDIGHNISIFEDKADADAYAKHINIDMTIYKLKCYYRDHIPTYDNKNAVLYLAYVAYDGGVNIYYTDDHSKIDNTFGMISSSVSPNMLEWMKPILTKYFGFNVVGEV